MSAQTNPSDLLRVDQLTIELQSRGRRADVVRSIDFNVQAGETVVLVGESGSGKSMTAMALMGLLPADIASITAGRIVLDEVDLVTADDRMLRSMRGPSIAMVFQDALSALNPVQRVGDQVAEVILAHEKVSRREAGDRAVRLLERVGIPSARTRSRDYPHQFSGGMRQRVMIAMAISLNPSLLIADEPTTALDVTIQAQIMELLQEIQRESGMSILLITHDLGVAAEVADRVIVMYAGKIVESGPVSEVFAHPGHPYTAGLLASMPAYQKTDGDLNAIAGQPPSLHAIPAGCAFRLRCPLARPACATIVPPLEVVGPDRVSACLFWEELVIADGR